MRQFLHLFILLILCQFCTQIVANLIDQLNFITSNSHFVSKPLQTKFKLNDIMAISLDLALQNCQESFKWQRWNCPSTDFLMRRTSNSLYWNREDAYVHAITLAAILYTITKNCASGIFADCGCGKSSTTASTNAVCADYPEEAERIYKMYGNLRFSRHVHGHIKKHNFMAISQLLRKSKVTKKVCITKTPSTTTTSTAVGCFEENYLEILKPFEQIAQDIKQMYEESIQITINSNARIIWKNIPLDTLIYEKDSPNYCEPNTLSYWKGTIGRKCIKSNDLVQLSEDERRSCHTLCRTCGYKVRAKNIITERKCNCKYIWGFQIHCELCLHIEQQYLCF